MSIDSGAARAKAEREGRCRVCKTSSKQRKIAPVHTISAEKQDRPWHEFSAGLWVDPNAVVPLCGKCAYAFKSKQISLLPYMGPEEQLNAVDAAGGILPAVDAIAVVDHGRRTS